MTTGLKHVLGANVRALRKAHDLTQAALAERIAVSPNMIGRIERGETAPSFDTIEALARVFDLTPGALFGDAPPVEPTPERARVIGRLMGRISRLSVEELGKVERAVRIVLD